MQLADLLRGRDATRIADLAQELGVSRRTLLRDIGALRERGLPISGEAGPGGGIRLQGERGLAAVHLSLTEARTLRALCRRVIVGPPASAKTRAGAGRSSPQLLSLFEEAFSNGRGLGFHYTDREGRASSRRVEPHGLLVETPVWYVLARDVDKGEPRMFRMDRITRPRLLSDVSFRPNPRVIQAQFPDLQCWRPLSGGWTT